jgi:hypothetical protein
MAKIKNKKAVMFIIFLMVLLGIGMVYNTGSKMLQASKSNDWIETTGLMTKFEIIKQNYSGAVKKNGYIPKAEYKYSVNGRIYVGNRIMFYDDKTRDYDDIEELKKKFAKNKKIPVYYNPQNKSESILIREGLFYGDSFISLLVGSLIAIFGSIMIRLVSKE